MGKSFLVLFLALIAACTTPDEPTSPLLTALAQENVEPLAAPAQERLFTIPLPEGDVGSINVGWWNNGTGTHTNPPGLKLDPNNWLSQGYTGVRFVGAGVGKTRVRCTSWDGCTISVIRHAGVVSFEQMTIYWGPDRMSNLGEQNIAKGLVPEFAARFIDCDMIAEVRTVAIKAGEPAVQSRPKWGVFGYNVDLYMENVRIDGKAAVEHDIYIHGFAKQGALIVDCVLESAGAEGLKVRSDATETAYAGPQPNIVVRDTTFRDWHQQWSWRGGAAIVIQGGASDVLIERCQFWARTGPDPVPGNARSHCVMVSSEGNSYDILTGAVGTGFGNGYVLVRQCVMEGRSDFDWSNAILRVAVNGGSQLAARGVLVEDSGLWGEKMTVQLGSIPRGMTLIRRCNTAAIRRVSRSLGMQAATEAMIPTATRLVPVSEGFAR